MTAIVALQDVNKVYGTPGHETVAVQDASVQVRPGELILLLGPSGSGKTTLLSVMAGLMNPTSGTVQLFGRPVAACSPGELQQMRAERIGFIFQTFRLLDALTALQNVALVPGFAGVGRREARRRAAAQLERLGVGHLGDRHPGALSQGEKQRVAIARAVVNGAPLVLADEPTGNLDSKRAMNVARLLRSMVDTDQRSVVVASHDERMTHFADRVLRIEDGVLREQGRAP